MYSDWIYTIDILFGLFVFLFVVGGLHRGLSGELAHVLTLAALLFGVWFGFPHLTQLAADYWTGATPWMAKTAAGIVLGLAALLFFVLVQAVLRKLLRSGMEDLSDRLTGALFGLLRGILTGLAVLVVLSLIPNESLYNRISKKSSIGGWVCSTLTPWVRPHIEKLPVFEPAKKKEPAPE